MKKIIITCSLVLAFNVMSAQDVIKPENVDYLRGALHYIYQWFLDPAHFFEQDQDKDLEVMIKKIDFRKDKDNYSERYNLIIPDLNLGVDLVKANYRIEKLDLQVTNNSFKIVAVYPKIRKPGTNEGFSVKILKENRVFTELLKKRNEKNPPSDEIMKKLRKSLAALVKIESKSSLDVFQTFYIGPLSEFSNDIWIFWETGKKLVCFSSATDFTTDGYWQLLPLFTKIYDLDTDVVTSLEEVGGSNAYITKTWAGRIMYNCIVDGIKIVIQPSSNTKLPSQKNNE